MANEYDDNQCIENQFTDDDCSCIHDIRPGGADGSAGGGIYGGLDGTEPVSMDRIDYMRDIPCGKFDVKAYRTLFYRAFSFIESLCMQLKNIACQFSLTTLAANETAEGVLTKIVDDDGNCRTALTQIETPSAYAQKNLRLFRRFETSPGVYANNATLNLGLALTPTEAAAYKTAAIHVQCRVNQHFSSSPNINNRNIVVVNSGPYFHIANTGLDAGSNSSEENSNNHGLMLLPINSAGQVSLNYRMYLNRISATPTSIGIGNAQMTSSGDRTQAELIITLVGLLS